MIIKYILPLLLMSAVLAEQRSRRQACNCKPLSQCSGSYSAISTFGRNECELENNQPGVCCPDFSQGNSKPQPALGLRSTTSLKRPSSVSDSQIKDAVRNMPSFNVFGSSRTNDQANQAHQLFTQYRDKDKDIYEAAEELLSLQQGLSLRSGLGSEGLDSSNSVDVERLCPWTNAKKPRCQGTGRSGREYRSVDGGCNNKQQPLFGMTGTPVQRIVPAQYAGDNEPRRSSSGEELPSARRLTTTVFSTGEAPNNKQISETYTQFGQFVDHDIAHAPEAHIECCETDAQGNEGFQFPSSRRHKECFPIQIPRNDSFWGPKGGRSCMNFVRSLPSPPLDCRVGAREQANALTHWLDLSNVYGSTQEEFELVRDLEDARLLRVSRSSVVGDLPPSCPRAVRKGESDIGACRMVCTEPKRKCTFSGDFRVNERPPLAVEHLQWIREHNRLARELASINPRWDSERVFQEARRINIAEYQHAIYNEWLPVTLGPQYMKTFKLRPLSPGSGYTVDYDESMDPRITNEFAGAAFRFGHSMVKGTITELDRRGRAITLHDLKEEFFDLSSLGNSGLIENTIRGGTRSRAAGRDAAFADDLVNHLFEPANARGGLDLMSLNIQRGRERGLPGYNRYRQECASRRFGKVDSFDALANDGSISKEEIKQLKGVYANVDDIDLFVGGMLEEPHRDSILGPTFKCLVGDQFIRLKRGDRFWYEYNHEDGFTLAQVNEIRKFSMARLICDNFNIAEMQPLVFLTNDGSNKLVDCKDAVSIPRLNMDVFRE